MTKKEYLRKLKRRLYFLKSEEKRSIIDYYDEMIDDKIESGCTENVAVSDLESPKTVADKVREDRKAEGKSAGVKLSAPIMVLLIVGSPLWLGLSIGLFGICIGLVVVAAVVPIVLVLSGAATLIAGIIELFQNVPIGVTMIGSGLAAGALGCLAWVVLVWFIKKTIIRKENKIK